MSPTALQKFSAVIAETHQQQQLDNFGFPLSAKTKLDDSDLSSYVDQLIEIEAPPGMVRLRCCLRNIRVCCCVRACVFEVPILTTTAFCVSSFHK